MKFILSFIVIILVSDLQAQNLNWAIGAGGSSDDQGNSVKADAFGNTYVTGTFSATADFDPGPGMSTLTSAGGTDIFVAKFNEGGHLVWVKAIGGLDNDAGISITIFAGKIGITGYFQETADFDPGAGVYDLTSFGGEDIFFLALDSSGNFIQAKQIGGTGDDSPFCITSGSVYITGVFSETADFDPGPGTFNLTAVDFQDIFILKLDNAGNFVWAKTMGGSFYDGGVSIALDVSGNVYSTGFFKGTVDFDPGAGVYDLTSTLGGEDIYISKLSPAGDFIWAKNIGGSFYNVSNSIATDAAGACYLTGTFDGTMDFDPGAAVFDITTVGFSDIFVFKLDASGGFAWAKSMGGALADAYGKSITVDASGNINTTGSFDQAVDFDPGGAVYTLTPDNYDVFVFQLDAAGNFKWAVKMGGPSSEAGNSIASGTHGKLYITGYFQGTADFDPGPTVYNQTSAGDYDFFLVKLGQDNIWSGESSNLWGNPANWTSGTVPGISSHVLIPSGKPRYPIVTASTEVKSLYIQNGASVTVASSVILKINGY